MAAILPPRAEPLTPTAWFRQRKRLHDLESIRQNLTERPTGGWREVRGEHLPSGPGISCSS